MAVKAALDEILIRFLALPVIVLPGYSRPLVRVQDYRELVEHCRYDGAQVSPPGPWCHRARS